LFSLRFPIWLFLLDCGLIKLPFICWNLISSTLLASCSTSAAYLTPSYLFNF
jgi:hypothetical protein